MQTSVPLSTYFLLVVRFVLSRRVVNPRAARSVQLNLEDRTLRRVHLTRAHSYNGNTLVGNLFLENFLGLEHCLYVDIATKSMLPSWRDAL